MSARYQSRHYKDIAKILGRWDDGLFIAKEDFIPLFKADNPKFDEARFIRAVEEAGK